MSDGQPDVAVLGAGIAGLSIAWQLLRRGAKVSIISGVEPAASAVAAGVVAPLPKTEINPPPRPRPAAAPPAHPAVPGRPAGDPRAPTRLRHRLRPPGGFVRC